MLILSARHMIKAKQMYQRKIGVSRALLSNSVMLCVCVFVPDSPMALVSEQRKHGC